MAIQITANTTLGIVLGAPATYDQVGFEALTYTNVGCITNFGDFGATATVTPFVCVDDPVTNKFIDAIDNGDLALTIGKDLDDAGQALFQDAVDTDNAAYGAQHSVKITYPDGDVEYFTCKVSGYNTSPGGANDVITANTTLAIDNKSIIVEV